MNFHFNLASQVVPTGVTYFVDKMALGEIIYVSCATGNPIPLTWFNQNPF